MVLESQVRQSFYRGRPSMAEKIFHVQRSGVVHFPRFDALCFKTSPQFMCPTLTGRCIAPTRGTHEIGFGHDHDIRFCMRMHLFCIFYSAVPRISFCVCFHCSTQLHGFLARTSAQAPLPRNLSPSVGPSNIAQCVNRAMCLCIQRRWSYVI